LLQAGELGIAPDRDVWEYSIASRGDAILEFANFAAAETAPALRFRVSSHILREASPIFLRVFGGGSQADSDLDSGISDLADLPLVTTPSRFVCNDGTEVDLYRMPQTELNKERAMEILLHAAHMHHDEVPRYIEFEQFVAVAEVCLRYKCTSPLEILVEHLWFPQWMHKASENMPDGLLLISYTFGSRQLFTRMSKTAILNIMDESELQAKPWPQVMKDKVWAIRCAKMAQVYSCCVSTIQEYIRAPKPTLADETELAEPELVFGSLDTRSTSPVLSISPVANNITKLELSSATRCPKGSHWCDATNLGWLMLVFGELQLLPAFMKPTALAHLENPPAMPRRSLAQLFEALRTIASPPQLVHRGGPCDPAPSFRTAINDIYNSISGLTLYDVDGTSHGWALSRRKSSHPQVVLQKGLRKLLLEEGVAHGSVELPEKIRLKILSEVINLDDLHAAARINRGFYSTYKKNELRLMRNVVRADRRRILQLSISRSSIVIARGEDKFLKTEADVLRVTAAGSFIPPKTAKIDPPIENEAIVEVERESIAIQMGKGKAKPIERDVFGDDGGPGPSTFNNEESEEETGDEGEETEGEENDVSETVATPDSRLSHHPMDGPSSPLSILTSQVRPQVVDTCIRGSLDGHSTTEVRGLTQNQQERREKFRSGDPAFSEKMLVVMSTKQRREEYDVTIGHCRGRDDDQSSGCGSGAVCTGNTPGI
jgi:hypothetical protein